jgi:hypothetical protein
MGTEITIEVSNLYSEMYNIVIDNAGQKQTRQQVESLIHQLYQEVETQREENKISVTNTEEINNE